MPTVHFGDKRWQRMKFAIEYSICSAVMLSDGGTPSTSPYCHPFNFETAIFNSHLDKKSIKSFSPTLKLNYLRKETRAPNIKVLYFVSSHSHYGMNNAIEGTFLHETLREFPDFSNPLVAPSPVSLEPAGIIPNGKTL